MGIHDGHRKHMRQRYLNGGLDLFTDHESLELLLYYAIPRQDTNATAHALMERYSSLSAVLNAPIEDLKKVEGIGENAAILLRLVPQLYRKASLSRGPGVVLNSVERAGNYLLKRFIGERNEVVYALCLDAKGRLLACRQVGTGGVSFAELDIRKLMENVLGASASAVILSHNHPSGVALPSSEDFEATDRAKVALQTIGVRLVDHIIVADREFASMADSGYFFGNA